MSRPTLEDGAVHDLARCPQCSVANPLLTLVGKADLYSGSEFEGWWYFSVKCSKCGRLSLMFGRTKNRHSAEGATIFEIFPQMESVSDELPLKAKNFFNKQWNLVMRPTAH
ncbi:MAG: hypothetical protein KKD64_09215 [Alphaproteobacteria bacterium]|nr:hypothetical protein [Alphaproteobacteria bacterium]MBU0794012.1 hypothetical protein [Alphaproteobacteria bacterium]MBU0874508.1 hypothetical protein [Alphaproteobacteria bacterium]MBU1769821.1 hypothetical protein [Alphaproteobacteria bacterium]